MRHDMLEVGSDEGRGAENKDDSVAAFLRSMETEVCGTKQPWPGTGAGTPGSRLLCFPARGEVSIEGINHGVVLANNRHNSPSGV